MMMTTEIADTLHVATELIVETPAKTSTFTLKSPLSLGEIYDFLYQRTGHRYFVSMSGGVARASPL